MTTTYDDTPNIITIEGIDRSVCFINSNMSIENVSSETPSIFKAEFFDKDGLGSPELDDEIIVTKGAEIIFGGKILEIAYIRLGALKNILSLTCTSYVRELNRNLVKENYQNMTDKAVIQDIIFRYCIGSEITADEFVIENITIQNIVFNYMTPGDCLTKICKLSGYNWYLDYNKAIHYFPLTTNTAPESITDTSTWIKDLSISKDNSNIRNRVYVRGGTYLSEDTTISQVADGEQTVFILPEKPHAPVGETSLIVEEDDVVKTVGIKNINKAEDFDYLLSYQEKYIITTVPPVVGTVMKYTFRYDVPVLVAVEDRDSIEDIGQYEFAIFDKDINNQDDARARALAELTDYATTLVDGSFFTYESGFSAGQYIDVTLTGMDIDGESYLIQKVTATSIGKGIFLYSVEIVNTKKLGIITFLKRMLEAEKNTVNSDVDETVDELYTPSTQDIIVTDTLISSDFTSPPFKWGTAKWGFSQWGH